MRDYEQELIRLAKPLEDREGIGPLVQALKNKRIVMIGEASHGTKEFYDWRQYITKELILNHGFDFVAVEGDWPACQRIDQFTRGKSTQSSYEVLSSLDRWPTWMWSNYEVLEFIDWLKKWNENGSRLVGFHGLDVYSLYESMDRVIEVLKTVDPELALEAEAKYSCLEAYRHNELRYAKSLLKAPQGCQEEITQILQSTLKKKIEFLDQEEAWFDIRQNAQIVSRAENYYRAMVFGDEDSWNVRDQHMMSTLEMLLDHYGPGSKAIIWEHNTHIGDYKATDMVVHGQVNIGGLAREIYGAEQVGLVGFGTYAGGVTASSRWDGPVTEFDVPEAKAASVEDACHRVVDEVGASSFYMIFDPADQASALSQMKGHRAIGVVYDPEIEHRGNYVPTSLANRYDAFIFLDYTHAVLPLNMSFDKNKIPETYPFGNRM